jgi:hypothetical protein
MFTEMTLGSAMFWGVTACNPVEFTDVSEEVVSIFRIEE